MSYIVIAEI